MAGRWELIDHLRRLWRSTTTPVSTITTHPGGSWCLPDWFRLRFPYL